MSDLHKNFTETQLAEYAALPTTQEKAKYLMQFEIVAKMNIVNLTLVSQAFIGKVALPITGDNDDEVIEKAKRWLKEKASNTGGNAQ